MEALLLVLRWSHILGAILLVGGLAFMRFAFVPALNDTDEETRSRLHESVRRRWLPFVIIGSTLLLASGLTNFLLFNSTVKAEGWAEGQWMRENSYHAIFGVKFLIALAVFYLASGLVGRGTGTAWLRSDRSRWLGVTLGLAVAVIMLSGWLRNLHTGPAAPGTEPQGVRLEQAAQAAADTKDRYEDSAAGSAFRAEGDEAAAEPSAGTEPAASDEPSAEE